LYYTIYYIRKKHASSMVHSTPRKKKRRYNTRRNIKSEKRMDVVMMINN